MDKQLFTWLAKINSTSGSGYYGELFIEDYKGQKFKCYRGNLSDKQLKEWRGKWRFINLEYRNEQLYYVKSILCKPLIYDLMVSQHRTEQGKKMVAERENKELSLQPTESSGAG